jgi:toxin ParE1/3/4
MTPDIVRTPQAQQEIDDIAYFLAGRSEEAGFRFLEAVEKTLGLVAGMPGIGTPYQSPDPRLQGIRCFRISGFAKYLLFYRSFEGGIEVVRVIHGARNLKRMLGADDE